MKKALQTVGLTVAIALISLLAVGFIFANSFPHADADPNTVLAHRLMPSLRDGSVFRLADVYTEPWDTVQVINADEKLNEWTWRTLCAFDAGFADRPQGQQLLVFWLEGGVSRMVRFTHSAGMPWFETDANAEDGTIIGRDSAVFRATLVEDGGIRYYHCTPTSGPVAV